MMGKVGNMIGKCFQLIDYLRTIYNDKYKKLILNKIYFILNGLYI